MTYKELIYSKDFARGMTLGKELTIIRAQLLFSQFLIFSVALDYFLIESESLLTTFLISFIPLIIFTYLYFFSSNSLKNENQKVYELALKRLPKSKDIELFKNFFDSSFFYSLVISDEILLDIYKNPKDYAKLFYDSEDLADELEYKISVKFKENKSK